MSFKNALLTALGLAGLSLLPAVPAESTTPRLFNDCAADGPCPTMVAIAGGTFRMGSPDGEVGRYSDEGPQRSVQIRSFAIGLQEVTFAQWEACVSGGACRENMKPDDNGWGRGEQPVVNVSWTDATAYVQWLSRKTGHHYRLPTEAEWEYAARGGAEGPFPWGEAAPSCSAASGHAANFKGCGLGRAMPVGTFGDSGIYGLQDAVGNVWEWVEDCYSVTGRPIDGAAFVAPDCPLRVTRGGSWDVDPRDLRVANRFKIEPTFRSPHLGFRVARDLP
jgi:formylglycine-generating enzyme required for sulfatase activity